MKFVNGAINQQQRMPYMPYIYIYIYDIYIYIYIYEIYIYIYENGSRGVREPLTWEGETNAPKVEKSEVWRTQTRRAEERSS